MNGVEKTVGMDRFFCFDADLHPYLYEDFASDPERAIATSKGSEQYYTSMAALRKGQLAYLPG